MSSADPPRRLGRSLLALFSGLVAVVAPSIGTDLVLQRLAILPAPNVPMTDPGLNLLALAYRSAYCVLGSYLAARLAPSRPMRHAMILGSIGFVLTLLGVIVAVRHRDLGPLWYPVALAVTTLPFAWLGGVLGRAANHAR